VTSRRDDRVHPGHARKMAARLEAMEQPVFFYEPDDGGHGAANKEQAAFLSALGLSFLRRTLARGVAV
jgi:prolyl oligopeptidase